MKCKYCLAKIEITEPFCPTCGRRNPLAAPDLLKKAPFRLDDDPEVKPSSLPSRRPPVFSAPFPSFSNRTVQKQKQPELQAQGKACCLIFVILFILFVAFTILTSILKSPL